MSRYTRNLLFDIYICTRIEPSNPSNCRYIHQKSYFVLWGPWDSSADGLRKQLEGDEESRTTSGGEVGEVMKVEDCGVSQAKCMKKNWKSGAISKRFANKSLGWWKWSMFCICFFLKRTPLEHDDSLIQQIPKVATLVGSAGAPRSMVLGRQRRQPNPPRMWPHVCDLMFVWKKGNQQNLENITNMGYIPGYKWDK